MLETYSWVGSILTRPTSQDDQVTAAEHAWVEWMESPAKGNPPLIDPASPAMIRSYRTWLASARKKAAEVDPTTNRRYGILPPSKT